MLPLATSPALGGDPPPPGVIAPPASFDARTPELLTGIAPSVVKVRRGDRWESGFVFATTRQVVTSYALVNAPGKLEVVGADGIPREARVVAWFEADDLVLLDRKSVV